MATRGEDVVPVLDGDDAALAHEKDFSQPVAEPQEPSEKKPKQRKPRREYTDEEREKLREHLRKGRERAQAAHKQRAEIRDQIVKEVGSDLSVSELSARVAGAWNEAGVLPKRMLRDMRRRHLQAAAEVNPRVDRRAAPKEQPPRQAVPKEQPPRQAAPKEQPPRQAAPKEQPPRQAAPKEQPPRQAAPKEQPPRQAAPYKMRSELF